MFITISFVLQLTLVGQLYLIDARLHKGSITKFGNCSGLYGVPLKFECSGSITRELRSNYRDSNVIEGTPYAIFAPDDLMLFAFITMYSSPLMDCHKLTVIEWNTFNCDSNRLIKLPISKLYCYHYPMRYFADLRDACMNIRNIAYNAMDNSALHYADELSLASSWSANFWPMLFIGLWASKLGHSIHMS